MKDNRKFEIKILEWLFKGKPFALLFWQWLVLLAIGIVFGGLIVAYYIWDIYNRYLS